MTDQQRLAQIRITFKDGSVRQWPSQDDIERGLGAGYRLKYERGFVVLDNLGHTRTSIAADLIAEIQHTEGSLGF